MNERDDIPADYLNGFNNGYMIAEHLPDLAEKLKTVQSDLLRVQGLKDGIEEHGNEKTKDRRPDFLKEDRLSSLDKDEDKDIEERDRE